MNIFVKKNFEEIQRNKQLRDQATIPAKINVGTVAESFERGHSVRDRQGSTAASEIERELAEVKRELSLAKMERDILKKAAAYFAKESLHGTR